jgi:hypothetical protein
MHHKKADLRDIKKTRAPSFLSNPRNNTSERTPQTCLLYGEIGHSQQDSPDTCESKVYEHSLESNHCFLDHSEASVAEKSSVYNVWEVISPTWVYQNALEEGCSDVVPWRWWSSHLYSSGWGVETIPFITWTLEATRGNARVYILRCVNVHTFWWQRTRRTPIVITAWRINWCLIAPGVGYRERWSVCHHWPGEALDRMRSAAADGLGLADGGCGEH